MSKVGAWLILAWALQALIGCGPSPSEAVAAPAHPLAWANGTYHCDRMSSPPGGAQSSGEVTLVISDGTITGRMHQTTKSLSGLTPETIEAPYQFGGPIAGGTDGAVVFDISGTTADIYPGKFRITGDVHKNGRCHLASTSTVQASLAEMDLTKTPPSPKAIQKATFVLTLEGLGRRD